MGQHDRDACGMVYYDPKTGNYFFTHREDSLVIIACRYTLCGKVRDLDEHIFDDRTAAQAYLDRWAEKLNLIREPGLAGRWS